jgi:hypothetical protein
MTSQDKEDGMSVEIRQAAAKQVSQLLREWLNTRYETAKASAANEEQLKAIEQMRHLRLDDYSYTVAPKIVDYFVEQS